MCQSEIRLVSQLRSMRTDALKDVARLIVDGALTDACGVVQHAVMAELENRLGDYDFDLFCDDLFGPLDGKDCGDLWTWATLRHGGSHVCGRVGEVATFPLLDDDFAS